MQKQLLSKFKSIDPSVALIPIFLEVIPKIKKNHKDLDIIVIVDDLPSNKYEIAKYKYSIIDKIWKQYYDCYTPDILNKMVNLDIFVVDKSEFNKLQNLNFLNNLEKI